MVSFRVPRKKKTIAEPREVIRKIKEKPKTVARVGSIGKSEVKPSGLDFVKGDGTIQ